MHLEQTKLKFYETNVEKNKTLRFSSAFNFSKAPRDFIAGQRFDFLCSYEPDCTKIMRQHVEWSADIYNTS